MEMSRLMTAPALSSRVRPTAVRSRSPTSIVLTRWTGAVATEPFESGMFTGTSPGELGSGFPLLDLNRDGQVVPGVVIDDQNGGEKRPAARSNHRKSRQRVPASIGIIPSAVATSPGRWVAVNRRASDSMMSSSSSIDAPPMTGPNRRWRTAFSCLVDAHEPDAGYVHVLSGAVPLGRQGCWTSAALSPCR